MRHIAVEQALQQKSPTLLRIHSRPVSCQAVGNVDYHVWALRCQCLEAVDVRLRSNSFAHWKQRIWVQSWSFDIAFGDARHARGKTILASAAVSRVPLQDLWR